MAKITVVQKAAKDQGSCSACSEPILQGQAYRWFKPFRSTKRVRHLACPTWRPSEMATSEVLQMAYAAQEGGYDDLDTLTKAPSLADLDPIEEVDWSAAAAPLADAMAAFAENAREAAERANEMADSIEDGFGHETESSAEKREQADEIEAWASEAEDIDWPEAEIEDLEDPEEIQDTIDAWWEDCRQVATDVLDNCPV